MDVCVFECCVLSVRRADHSSRGVLLTAVRCVLSRNLVNVEALANWGLSRRKQTNRINWYWEPKLLMTVTTKYLPKKLCTQTIWTCDTNVEQYFHGDKHKTLTCWQSFRLQPTVTTCSSTQNVETNPGASPAFYFMCNGTLQGMKRTIVVYLVLRLRISGTI